MIHLLTLGILLIALLLPEQGAAQAALENEVPPPVAARFGSYGKPPSGIGGIVMGAVGLGLGGINLATIPVCYASFYPAEAKDLCVWASVGVGSALVAVGIPSLIVGIIRRKRYKAWRQQRVLNGATLKSIAVAPVLGGGQLLLRAAF
jgi:hypothetical protein